MRARLPTTGFSPLKQNTERKEHRSRKLWILHRRLLAEAGRSGLPRWVWGGGGGRPRGGEEGRLGRRFVDCS